MCWSSRLVVHGASVLGAALVTSSADDQPWMDHRDEILEEEAGGGRQDVFQIVESVDGAAVSFTTGQKLFDTLVAYGMRDIVIRHDLIERSLGGFISALLFHM